MTATSATSATRTTVAAVAVLLVAGVGQVSGARAADATTTVAVREGSLRFEDAVGVDNRPAVTTQVTTDGDRRTRVYRIDDVVPLAVGDGCTHPDAGDDTVVRCTLTSGTARFSAYEIFELGAGDDVMKDPGSQNPDLEILAGAGNDSIQADQGLLDGGEGDDTLIGPATAQDYRGVNFFNQARNVTAGPGDDWIVGTEQADRIRSGGGHNVIYGKSGDDLISGDDGSNEIDGGAGADQIRGGSGTDVIHGGTGDDRLWGYGGNDRLYGDAGADRMLGGPGADVMHGGPGNDRCYEVGGADRCYQD